MITILDGGMERELERMGAPFRQPEWSALALMDAPEAVRDAHLSYVQAGAEVFTTNAYACVPFHIGEERFAKMGRDLIALAGKLAREAADTGVFRRYSGRITRNYLMRRACLTFLYPLSKSKRPMLISGWWKRCLRLRRLSGWNITMNL